MRWSAKLSSKLVFGDCIQLCEPTDVRGHETTNSRKGKVDAHVGSYNQRGKYDQHVQDATLLGQE